MQPAVIPHPKGKNARVLLSSVFGPYACDDIYGSRAINPMELYQNQVTRVQGGFSLRMFHRSFGLLMLQSNIDAPCTVLDFASRDRFIQELRDQTYDVIGISAILPNIEKVKEMCRLIRQYQPKARIVIGGHITNYRGLYQAVDADHIVRGEGVAWFRKFLGQPLDRPVKHPAVLSAFGTRILGINLSEKPEDTAAILIPSVGCPMGCNFCSTSALFGGKGKFVNFYETGDELFEIMCRLEDTLKVNSFFILDENFLLHRRRAIRLLDLMKNHQKSWVLNVFSSARVLRSYTIEQLVGLGIGWVWMGIEGKGSQYAKLADVDTYKLVKLLQSHGIRVLGSSIIGLANHTAENIDQVISDAVRHATDFHQFMLYTPVPGTPLYEEHKKDGSLLGEDEFPFADAHGQYRFNYRHIAIEPGQEEEFLLRAFKEDFNENGPSLARLIRTLLTGWQRYKNCPDQRVRKRYAREVSPLRTTYAGAVWAMKRYYRKTPVMSEKMKQLLRDINREFGWKTRLVAPVIGLYAYLRLMKEERLLASGWRYEPATFYDKNPKAEMIQAGATTSRQRQHNSFGEFMAPLKPVLKR